MSPVLQFIKCSSVAIIIAANSSAVSAKATFVGVNDVRGGSLLFATQTPGQNVPAPLLATDVEISVSGPIARVKVRQKFFNPSKYWLSGRYVFPLPQNSAVHHLIIRAQDREIIAEIKEKAAARKIYKQAQQAGRRAALIEQHRPNIFTTDVANLAPGSTIDVVISYLQPVRYDQGQFKLRFPMVVAPRFTPRARAQLVSAPEQTLPTGAGPDRPLPRSPVLHPDEGRLNPVKLVVHLDAGVPLTNLTSPHHQIVASDWQDGKSDISLAENVVPADRDFELIWTPEPSAKPLLALFHEKMADEHFIIAMVLPPAPDKAPPPQQRDVIFVLDKSGSMGGASIRQARKALIFALARLKPEDRFNIVRFANQTDILFDGLQKATENVRRQAVVFVQGTQASGGTNMRPALLAALNGTPTDGRLRQIIFLTDAAIGNEAALFDDIAMRIGQNRLFTVGIGSAPNSYFMQRAAELGRGSFTYIGNTQKVGETMQALFRKIEHPMARDLSVSWDRFPDTDHQVDAYPGRLPDLYDGEPVILAARIKNGGASLQNRSLTISGRIGSLPWQRKVDLASAHPIKGAGTLWGRARIADLMMSLHRGAESKSVRKAVTVTALRHHIVSRYTSLVAVEKTITRPADEPLFPRSVPRNLPDGWDFEKVFGEDLKSRAAIADPAAGQAQNRSAVQSASKKMAHAGNNMALLKRPSAPMVTQGQTILLPAGSTSAGLNLIAGLFALLMGLVLIRLKRST